MHKSLSVSRQGTFDTGRAQLDKRGSIRRGDVELPIVDEASVRQQSSDKSHNDSGVETQLSSADKNRSPTSEKSLSNVTAQSTAEEEAAKKGTQESPRYIDHNKLFPEIDSRYEEVNKSVNQDREKSLNSSYLSDSEKRKGKFSDIDDCDTSSVSRSRETSDANNREKQQRRGSIRGSLDRSPAISPRSSVHEATVPHNKTAGSPCGEHPELQAPSHKEAIVSDQKSARQHALARLKAPRSEEAKSDLDSDHSKRSPRKPTDQSTSHNSKEESEDQDALPIAGSLKKKLQQSLQPQQQKADPKQTSHTHQEHQAQETLRVQKKSYVVETPIVLQPPQKSQAQPSSYNEQKSHLPKTPHVQQTPVVQPSPVSPGEQANSTADKPTSIVIPRLSVETKVPAESTKKPKIDQSSPQSTGEHLRTNIVKGKAWDQPQKKTETVIDKEVPVKPEASKPVKSSPRTNDTPKPDSTQKETSNDKRSGSGPKSTMALTEGRPHGGDTLARVTAERDQLLRTERTYKQRILQLEEEVKAAVMQSQELSSENKALRTKLEAYEDKTYGGSLELKELRREKQELVGMVAKVTGEKEELNAENEKLSARLQEAESKSKQWDSIYIENNKLKTKQAELEKKIQDVEKEKNGLQNNLKTAESKEKDKMAAVQEENKKLQAELINMQTKNNSLERKTERLEAENKEILERLEQKRTELDELIRAMNTEPAENKISDYKKELDEANRRYQNAEKEKDSAKAALRSKESECKTLKVSLEEKESQISDLKRQVDASKQNAKRLEDEIEDSKQAEKDAINMKARIRSLKNEIEDSLAANHKMKEERTDARLEADRLNRELAAASESLSEAKRYIKKLESERVSREKVDEELKAYKQREQELERQLFDLNVRSDQLKQKLRELQDDKDELLETQTSASEVEGVNRKLQDENRKLRQMLVERNIELAHRQSERTSLVHRVDNLERKQNDSDIKVQQLKGWVDTMHTSEQPHHLHPSAEPLVTLPPVPSHGAPRASKPGGRGKKKTRQQQQQQQQQQNQLNRSWEDLKRTDDLNGSVHTTPSLPVVLDSKFALTGGGPPGYYDMYKHKMKLIRERRW